MLLAGRAAPPHLQGDSSVHPLAWWGWALGLAVAVTRTTNTLVIALLVAAVVLVVVVETFVTGALHLDGLADVADGAGGGDRQARLRIMKDHATGVYGTAAVVLALVLEVALLVDLALVLAGRVLLPWTRRASTARAASSRAVVPVEAPA